MEPEFNGPVRTRIIRERGSFTKVVSTEGSKQRIEELETIGSFGYVRKPFQPEQLRDVLKPLLGVKEDAAEPVSDVGDDLF